MEAVRISSISTALPPTALEQADLPGLLPADHPGERLLRRILAGSGIRKRHLVIDPRVEDVSLWSTAPRMRRFQDEGLPLATEAVRGALDRAGVPADGVGLLCLVSSTGYGTPGVDSRLIRDLGMRPSTRRLVIGHMGCFAALPGLAACVDFARSHPEPAVLLSLELSSLHLQPPPWDTEQFVINSLFSDAAVALVVEGDTGRSADVRSAPVVLGLASHTAHEHEEHMTWEVGDHGFKMGLSAAIPDLIAACLPDLVAGLLSPHGLVPGDVGWWAVHPGGRRIIDAAEESLALGPSATRASRHVLQEYGNCSSAGLPLVIAELQDTTPLASGKYGVAMTFGPGLTLDTALLLGG
ncbi:type III polyketide synthase [Nocardiopsis sp. CT-R113]|uniref:Type III polyketide synthase n=1 Tax=Nocardiopsis codii TaxID=3065942 RepID=A0ABU7K968_9ACTN|nr:type III polyketide synthase [Nocardiopsis sp. CT-R113]MEE2038784.1 type III polyketide synthase [Nocardiopsis sp. CT-R113]